MLPLFHVYGLNAVLGGWLYGGARLVVVDGMPDFFDIVRDEGVTNLPVSPALLARILASDRLVDGLRDVSQWFPVPHRFGTISGSRSPSARACE